MKNVQYANCAKQSIDKGHGSSVPALPSVVKWIIKLEMDIFPT